MVLLGAGRFLMTEEPLYFGARPETWTWLIHFPATVFETFSFVPSSFDSSWHEVLVTLFPSEPFPRTIAAVRWYFIATFAIVET